MDPDLEEIFNLVRFEATEP